MGTSIKPAGGVKSKTGGKGVAGTVPKTAATPKTVAVPKAAGRGAARGRGAATGRGVETVGIGPRINVSAAEFYEKNFGSLNSGTKYILEEFPHFFKQALAELRDIFDRNELKLLIETLQFGWINFVYYKENVTNKIIEAQNRGLFEKYNVEKKILNKKVKNITNFHGFVLLQLGDILSKYTGGDRDCNNKDFDIYEYINELIGEGNLINPAGKFPWIF